MYSSELTFLVLGLGWQAGWKQASPVTGRAAWKGVQTIIRLMLGSILAQLGSAAYKQVLCWVGVVGHSSVERLS